MAPRQARFALLFLFCLTLPFPQAAQAVPGDENWDTRFGLPGVSGSVHAAAVFAGDLIIGGDFVAVGGLAITNLARWDGSAWTAMGEPLTDKVEALIIWNGELYAGGSFPGCLARWDGAAWIEVGGGVEGTVDDFAIWNSQLVLAGSFESVGGSTPVGKVATWDGSSWGDLDGGMPYGSVSAVEAYSGLLYACGEFDSAGGNFAANLARWNGTSWSGVGGGLSDEFGDIDNAYGHELAVHDGQLVIGGNFGRAGSLPVGSIVRWNGSAFSALGTPFLGDDVYALGLFGSDLVAGDFYGNIHRWLGTHWSTVGIASGYAVTIVEWSGSLIVGGEYSAVSGLTAAGLARYDGTWSLMATGQGASGIVEAFCDWNGTPVVGGYFGKAGQASNRVAAWDGEAWLPLGTGIAPTAGAYVGALTAFEGDLIVGGSFTTAGGVPANKIARWDGAQWSAMGAGSLGEVSGLLVLDGVLYANGYWAGQQTLGRWNGSEFDPLGTGIVGGVQLLYGLGAYQGDPVMVGNFNSVDGVAAANIARWDGTAWQSLAAGTSAAVYAVCEVGGLLYVGGAFLQAGGLPASRVAVWDGASWSALGAGVNGRVFAVTAIGTDIYVTGEFTQAGGQPAPYVARWDGEAWHPLGSGLDAEGRAAVAIGGELWLGGEFLRSGTAGAARVARWLPGDTAAPPLGWDAPRIATQPAWPNPFASSTAISFALPAPASVEIDVFDVRGAQVRDLTRTGLAAGSHRVVWDGRDGSGRPVPAGVYFVALRDGRSAAQQRVVLLR